MPSGVDVAGCADGVKTLLRPSAVLVGTPTGFQRSSIASLDTESKARGNSGVPLKQFSKDNNSE